jgi:hypothetical protein
LVLFASFLNFLRKRGERFFKKGEKTKHSSSRKHTRRATNAENTENKFAQKKEDHHRERNAKSPSQYIEKAHRSSSWHHHSKKGGKKESKSGRRRAQFWTTTRRIRFR